MARMIDGEWEGAWTPADAEAKGRFVRKESSFRGTLPTGNASGDIEPGRYHLYVSWTCPWAHRTLLVRALKGLQDRIPVHHANELTDRSWRFADGPEPLYGAGYLYELYLRANPRYTGRVTVPVLWDSVEERIVNNESAEIVRILDALPSDAPRLSPPELRPELDAMADRLYDPLNNGVYRAGFARTQEAYDEAVTAVFRTLDGLEAHLDARDWLVDDRLTEADLRLFVTLFRFDAAYYTLFKCNLKRVADYPNLRRHLARVYGTPGVADTCNLDAAKRGYASIRAINPHGIVPIG